MIEPGQAAPDFTLPDQDGNAVALSQLRGKTVVLYFYPKADTCGTISSNGDQAAPRSGNRPGL